MTPTGKASNDSEILRVLKSKGDVRAYYDKIAQVYDLLSERAERPMREAGLQMLSPRERESVLEIGCGTGHCLAEIARKVGPRGRVSGIDLSENMLRQARRALVHEGLSEKIGLVCGDAEQLPLPARSQDAVFMSFTLELFDTPAIPRVLAECLRVLRPGGRIAAVAVSKEGESGLMVDLYEWTHRHFPNLLDCRPIYVRRSLEQAGFTVKESRQEHMWIPVEIVAAEKPA